jgi:5-methylcytosine-specific restriction endonuclease McrA
MGRTVEKTRNNGQWSEARYFGFIRSALRAAFMKWGPKHTAKMASKIAYNQYQCAACEEIFTNREVEVDHIVGAGSLKTFDDLPQFVERMFCEADGFQVLCKPCHQLKTNEERKKK